MKRLIGNAIGIIVFLFLLQMAIGMIPAIAATTQAVFKQLVPNLDLTYSAGEAPLAPPEWPYRTPYVNTEVPEPVPSTPIEVRPEEPVQSPEPTATPLPEVTVDPVVPEPSPTQTNNWICPVVGEGGC